MRMKLRSFEIWDRNETEYRKEIVSFNLLAKEFYPFRGESHIDPSHT